MHVTQYWLKFRGGTTDLSENSIAQAPTNTTYWIDETTQTALGVDFDNYTLTQDTSASTTTYLIQSETDLAFLSWTIYNDNPFGGSSNKVTSGSNNYFYSNITFKQTKDLNLSAYYWQPIGISYTREGTRASRHFSGNYDGDGYTISGVYTPAGTDDGYSYQGLFGSVRGLSSTNKATIQNVGVIDSFIQGGSSVGGVVGNIDDTTISNCYNTGSVSGRSSVGGVVGYAPDSTITNCYNTGTVEGQQNVGGVVGNAFSTDMSNCYNTGTVSGTGSAVGGVVGSASSRITNCYNSGSVSGNGSVGGVVGYAYSGSTITITNTYYGGDCEASIGGIKGADVDGRAEYLADLEALAKNEEWYLDSSNWNSSYPWNFETVWAFVSGAPNYVVNNGYPVLQSFGTEIPEHEIIYWTDEYVQTKLGVDFDNYTLTQDTSASTTTYLIQSEIDLAFLSWTIYNNKAYNNHKSSSYFYSGISFKQTKNLDLSDYYWQPIGISYTRDGNGTSVFRYFSGNYDGDGHTVSSVFTPEGEGNNYYYQGLFGDVRSQNVTNMSTIQNIGVIDSFIQGSRGVGGVVGNAQSATITNCYNTGSFSGSYVGGVVGQASSATITNCYNTGSFSVGGSVGGVVGDTSDSTITNCYNTGTVDGKNYVGGVVGHTPDLITITNC